MSSWFPCSGPYLPRYFLMLFCSVPSNKRNPFPCGLIKFNRFFYESNVVLSFQSVIHHVKSVRAHLRLTVLPVQSMPVSITATAEPVALRANTWMLWATALVSENQSSQTITKTLLKCFQMTPLISSHCTCLGLRCQMGTFCLQGRIWCSKGTSGIVVKPMPRAWKLGNMLILLLNVCWASFILETSKAFTLLFGS